MRVPFSVSQNVLSYCAVMQEAPWVAKSIELYHRA